MRAVECNARTNFFKTHAVHRSIVCESRSAKYQVESTSNVVLQAVLSLFAGNTQEFDAISRSFRVKLNARVIVTCVNIKHIIAITQLEHSVRVNVTVSAIAIVCAGVTEQITSTTDHDEIENAMNCSIASLLAALLVPLLVSRCWAASLAAAQPAQSAQHSDQFDEVIKQSGHPRSRRAPTEEIFIEPELAGRLWNENDSLETYDQLMDRLRVGGPEALRSMTLDELILLAIRSKHELSRPGVSSSEAGGTKSRGGRNRAAYDMELIERFRPSPIKRNEGPTLSVVSPLDVLRSQLLYEMARRRKQLRDDQLKANEELIRKVG